MSARRATPATGRVNIAVEDRGLTVDAGISVAAALLGAGITSFRRSVTGTARAPLCGMGMCQECRVTIDDVPHRRACLVIVENGMRVST